MESRLINSSKFWVSRPPLDLSVWLENEDISGEGVCDCMSYIRDSELLDYGIIVWRRECTMSWGYVEPSKDWGQIIRRLFGENVAQRASTPFADAGAITDRGTMERRRTGSKG